VRVGVQCDQSSVPEPVQDRPRMAARPEGRVDVNSAWTNRQIFERRPNEHGNVAQHNDTTSYRPSSPMKSGMSPSGGFSKA